MEELVDISNLGLNHIQVIVRAMYEVASCDGVHQTELVMIRGFYEACLEDAHGLTDFDQVVGEPWSGDLARDVLDTAELRSVALRSCLLLAFADGHYSEAERDTVRRLAKDLAIDTPALAQLEEAVKGHLLRQISGIRDIEALREVYKELG